MCIFSHIAAPTGGPPSQTASSVMESVTNGINDWYFLRTEEDLPKVSSGVEKSRTRLKEEEKQATVGKRPSLEDFDGEIAVFQVQCCMT